MVDTKFMLYYLKSCNSKSFPIVGVRFYNQYKKVCWLVKFIFFDCMIVMIYKGVLIVNTKTYVGL